jgi:hypothetical protein
VARRVRSQGSNGSVDTAAVTRPTLAVAFEPPSTVPLKDRLTLSLADIAALTGLSRRLLERELAAGRWPKPDLRVGRRCLWRQNSVRRALGIEEGSAHE